MLVGRLRERARIEQMLHDVRRGKSSVLILRGEAGIGKTVLVQHAVEHANGMIVLSTRGLEAESDLAFSALSHLLGPVVDLVDRLSPGQRAALMGAFGLGRPVQGDPFAVYSGVLSLLGHAAEKAPLLVTVDDAHWLDRASAAALLFASRRLEVESIGLLLAVRDDEESVLSGASLASLRIGPLESHASAELLARAHGSTLAPSVAERVLEAAGGNPMALVEIPRSLTQGQRTGTEPLDAPLPVGPGLERAFRRRLTSLDRGTRRALLLAAASESGRMREIVAAAPTFHVDVATLQAAEDMGLVAIDGVVLEWVHPLLRGVVYHGAPVAERRAAHRALAGALGSDADVDRRAWHLAASTLTPDEQTAAALEGAAVRARSRSGYAAAARAFERAAELSPDQRERGRRLFEAGAAHWRAGDPRRAVGLLDCAIELTGDPRLQADAQRLWCEVVGWTEGPSSARIRLQREAQRIEPLDPARATRMLADAVVLLTMTADLRGALATARNAQRVAQRAGPQERLIAQALLSNALILRGHAAEAEPLLERCRRELQVGEALLSPDLVLALGHGPLWLGDYASARSFLEGVVSAGRETGALGLLPYPLSCLSELEFRTGHWMAATATASESLELAETAGQDNQSSFSMVCLAYVEAGRGRDVSCREHVARALSLAERFGTEAIHTYAGGVLGLLSLGMGDTDDAVVELERVSRLTAEQGLAEPGVVWWEADFIEALAAAGDRTGARRAMAAFEERVRTSGAVWARAATARCRGLLAGDDEFEPEFAEALRWFQRTRAPFEEARTRLYLGERLLRTRDRRYARDHIRVALRTFGRLQARPWSKRASERLRAAGWAPEPRPEGVSDFDGLTPRESQVAAVVAQGATNKQVATQLFLSEKTVEYHLGHVYRKLGVSSRSQLTRLLARTEGP